MEQTKPQRRTCIFDYWNVNKKKKLTNEPQSETKKSITSLEDLSNELFYEIFNFLDAYHVYKAFYDLNIRIQNLLINPTVPLKINISAMSKSNFQRYHRHIIMPNKNRIRSLYLSNPFVVDLIFSPVRIASNFVRLETLIFDNIKSKYLVNIIHHLTSLPNLSNLIIIPIDRYRNPNNLYDHIFRLPALKYCKLSLKERFQSYSLPIAAANVTSPIEHLVINSIFNLNNVNALLSYVPQLRRLSFHYLDGINSRQSETFSISLNNLTHVSIDMKNVTFDEFEPMVRKLFNHLQVLRISSSNDGAYLNAKRWEHLILSSMSQLRIFDFQYINFLQNDNDNCQATYNPILNQFSSTFWIDRKWGFAYKLYSEDYRNQVIFYSINPYRRKHYILYRRSMKDSRPYHQRRNMKSVDHVEIQGEEEITNCINYFGNATKLTLSHSFHGSRIWLSINLKRIIPLNQLTTLIIDSNDFYFEQFIKLLRLTPNIHTLTFNCQSIDETNSTTIQQSETFRLAANTNRITNMNIRERYSSENIKLIIALCPRLEQLVIDIDTQHIESIVRFILLKTKTNLQHLCSLCIKATAKSMVGVLKTLIESEELLDNYSIKVIDTELYFWW